MRGLEPADPTGEHKTWPVVVATFAVAVLAGALGSLAVMAIAALVASQQGVPLDDCAALELIARELVDETPLGIVVGIFSTASILAAASLWLTTRDGPGNVRRRLRLMPVPLVDVGLAVLGMLALTTVLSQAILLLGVGEDGAIERLRSMFASLSLTERLMMLPITALVAGTAEELFFRGYALTKLDLSSGPIGGVVTSALLFGFIHFDPVHSTAAAVMGLFLGYCVLRTGSLWTSLAAHVVNNAVATIVPDLGPGDVQSQVILLLVSLVVLAAVLMGLRRRPSAPAVQW